MKIKIIFFACFLLFPTIAAAYYNALPEVMVGNTEVTSNSDLRKYHAGMTGNEAIVNFDPNFSVLTGFNQSYLTPQTSVQSCYLMDLASISRCYNIVPSSNIFSLMTSRTYQYGVPVLEMATILYPDKTIVGDAYNESNTLLGFNFYGRNLNKSGIENYGDYATWEESFYQMNTAAQSYYDANSLGYYQTRIDNLESEAAYNEVYFSRLSVPPISHDLYLQYRNLTSPVNDESKLTPEGKVWRIASSNASDTLVLKGNYIYHGKGTLIIDNPVQFTAGTTFLPADSESSLGIIVRGGIEFFGNNKVRAAIFSEAAIRILDPSANNVMIIGSVVAKSFRIGANRYAVRFFYDYNLENNWPPGFRYFKMPTPDNAK